MTKEQVRKSKFYESDSFKKQQDEWYKKLKDKGFKDIEHNESTPYLTNHHIRDSRAIGRGSASMALEYYQAASEFLWQHKFPNKYDRYVWEQHTRGKSIRDIVKLLSVHRTKKWRTSRFLVHESIKRSKLTMKQWLKDKHNGKETDHQEEALKA